MKTILISLTLFFTTVGAIAQDVIIKNDKSEIKCRVTEIAETAVKYKKWDNLTGPIYSVPKADVFMIRYENGTTETFDVPAPKKEDPEKTIKVSPDESNAMKNSLAAGYGFFNPVFASLRPLSESASGSTYHFTWSSLPNETKWFSSAVRLYVLSGTVTNYDKTNVNLSLAGFGFQGKFNANWIHHDTWSMYSGFGLGYFTGSVTASDASFKETVSFGGVGFQLDALAIQGRENHWGYYYELGYGTEGVFKLGVQYCW